MLTPIDMDRLATVVGGAAEKKGVPTPENPTSALNDDQKKLFNSIMTGVDIQRCQLVLKRGNTLLVTDKTSPVGTALTMASKACLRDVGNESLTSP